MFKKIIILLLAICLSPLAANASTPKEYAENLADIVISVIQSQKSEDAKEKDLIELFRKNVDANWMAGYTMGQYYRQLSPEQKARYNDLYRDYVIYSYIPKFRMYTGERMVVTQTIEDDKDFYTVKTTLKTKASSTGSVLVDYKLKRTGDSYKIIDIIGEGVSLINTQRSDFAVPLADGVDSFLDKLAGKVSALKSNPPKALKTEKLNNADNAGDTSKNQKQPKAKH